MTLPKPGKKVQSLSAFVLLMLALPAIPPAAVYAKEGDSITISETGKTIRGPFMRYWLSNGATSTQGFPISDEMQEKSDTDGKLYTVQYFERAVFEYHPENQIPYDVLLSLLGTFAYKQKYPDVAPNQEPSTAPDARIFPETGKRLGCRFLDYWTRNGGLAQFGYPISDELMEKSDLDGKPRRVQYFQRQALVYDQYAISRFDDSSGYVLPTQMGAARFKTTHTAEILPVISTPTANTPTGCAPTGHGPSVSDSFPNPPIRSSVGKGMIVTGTVKSSQGCAPVANAKVIFWLAGPDGQYDDAHAGTVLTDDKGIYTFESNFPGFYGAGGPHIHLYVSADAYQGIETEIFAACGQTEGSYDVVLAPETQP